MKKIERECNMIEKKKWGNSLRVLKNQSREYLANLCESKSLETQVMLPKVMNYPDFFFESTNNMQIKAIFHRAIADGYIWVGISLMNAQSSIKF